MTITSQNRDGLTGNSPPLVGGVGGGGKVVGCQAVTSRSQINRLNGRQKDVEYGEIINLERDLLR